MSSKSKSSIDSTQKGLINLIESKLTEVIISGKSQIIN